MKPKTYSVLMLATDCVAAGVQHVVISPGSRSASLSLAFYQQKSVHIHQAVHENSAAFVALGLAQYTGRPVVLICTSGSAGLHYAAGIAEAFYQEVPLLVLTADRPAAWINQQDGQTLPQTHMYGKLVKGSYDFPQLTTEKEPKAAEKAWHARRIIGEALALCQFLPAGPVHINIPLYPMGQPTPEKRPTPPTPPTPPRICLPYERVLTPAGWNMIAALFKKHPKVLVLAGQAPLDKNILRKVQHFCATYHMPIVGDVLSNLHELPQLLRYAELFLLTPHKALVPDMLISFGGHILSKATKTFFRKHPPKVHLRIQAQDLPAPDTLQCLTHQVPLTAAHFFATVTAHLPPLHIRTRKTFLTRWQQAEEIATTRITRVHTAPFSQYKAMHTLLGALPHYVHLHLGNSMPVRYANYLGLTPTQEAVETYANRGVCGIDGCLSSAIGVCRANPYVLNVVLIGDISFLHDQGAMLHLPLPTNLRVVVFNDHGGGIFRLLPKIAPQSACESCFVMPQQHSLQQLAAAYKLPYTYIKDEKALHKALPTFLQSGPHPQMIEIETDPLIDRTTFATHISPTL